MDCLGTGVDAGDDYRTAQGPVIMAEGLAGIVGGCNSSLNNSFYSFQLLLKGPEGRSKRFTFQIAKTSPLATPKVSPLPSAILEVTLLFSCAVQMVSSYKKNSEMLCFPGCIASVFILEVEDIHDLWQRRILKGTLRVVGLAHYGGKLHAADVW